MFALCSLLRAAITVIAVLYVLSIVDEATAVSFELRSGRVTTATIDTAIIFSVLCSETMHKINHNVLIDTSVIWTAKFSQVSASLVSVRS